MSLLATLLLPAIWVVDAANGPGTQFIDLQTAVTAARNGDTILVRAGSYRSCSIVDKALTIRGAGPALTSVKGIEVHGVPAHAFLLISGLRSEVPLGSVAPGMLLVGPGSVLLNDCHALGASDTQGMAGVHLSGGVLVHATRCAFFGGDSNYVGPFMSQGGHGAEVIVQAQLVASSCAFVGGVADDNVFGFTCGGSGVMVVGASALLCDTTCIGGDAGIAMGTLKATGGDAVYLQGGLVRVVGGQWPILQGGIAQAAYVGANTVAGYALYRVIGSAQVHAGVVMVPANPGAPLTNGAVVQNVPDAPRLDVTASYLPSGETDVFQPMTVTYEGKVPYAMCFLMVGFRPAWSSSLIPDLLVDTFDAGITVDLLDGAGRFQFAFVPAFLLGLTGIPFLAQAGTFDPVLGPRLSNCDVRVYGP